MAVVTDGANACELVDGDLIATFNAAVKIIADLPTDGPFQPSNELKLQFYAYYKQATVGPCSLPKPRFYEFVKLRKWESWCSLGNMSKSSAMNSYISALKKVIEAMSMDDNVQSFMEIAGPIYDFVDSNAMSLDLNNASKLDSCANGFVHIPQRNGGCNTLRDSEMMPNVPSKAITPNRVDESGIGDLDTSFEPSQLIDHSGVNLPTSLPLLLEEDLFVDANEVLLAPRSTRVTSTEKTNAYEQDYDPFLPSSDDTRITDSHVISHSRAAVESSCQVVSTRKHARKKEASAAKLHSSSRLISDDKRSQSPTLNSSDFFAEVEQSLNVASTLQLLHRENHVEQQRLIAQVSGQIRRPSKHKIQRQRGATANQSATFAGSSNNSTAEVFEAVTSLSPLAVEPSSHQSQSGLPSSGSSVDESPSGGSRTSSLASGDRGLVSVDAHVVSILSRMHEDLENLSAQLEATRENLKMQHSCIRSLLQLVQRNGSLSLLSWRTILIFFVTWPIIVNVLMRHFRYKFMRYVASLRLWTILSKLGLNPLYRQMRTPDFDAEINVELAKDIETLLLMKGIRSAN